MPDDSTFFNSFLEPVKLWLATQGLEFLLGLVSAAVIFVVGRWLTGRLSRLVGRGLERAKVDATLRAFLVRIVQVLLLVVVVLAALDRLGVKTTSLVAIIGAAGLAIGLAMQGSLSNFAAGVMIIFFRPFRAGDFIDAGGVKGIVEEISIFHTHLRTPDNLKVIVPNAQVNGGAITNFSAKDTRRCDFTVGVSYEDDLKVAKEAIWGVLRADARILQDPAPIVGVMNLGESAVEIVIWPWVKAGDFLAVKFDLNEGVKAALEAAGCTIPYPQRDVHGLTERAEGARGEGAAR
jgi:small conductance mechanosensitive channel